MTLLSGEDFRGNPRFNSVIQARAFWEFMSDRLENFPAIRITGDVAWHLDLPLCTSLVCHWEATANLVFDDEEVRAICPYDLQSAPPRMIHAALSTQHQVLLGNQLFRNPFFEAHLILENEPFLSHSDATTTLIQSMLLELQSGEVPMSRKVAIPPR